MGVISGVTRLFAFRRLALRPGWTEFGSTLRRVILTIYVGYFDHHFSDFLGAVADASRAIVGHF